MPKPGEVHKITDAPSLRAERQRFDEMKSQLMERVSRLRELRKGHYYNRKGYQLDSQKPEQSLKILGKSDFFKAESELEIDFGRPPKEFKDIHDKPMKKSWEGREKEILSFLEDGSVLFWHAVERGKSRAFLEGSVIYIPEENLAQTGDFDALGEQYKEIPRNKKKVMEEMKRFCRIIDEVIEGLEKKIIN